MKKIYLAHPLLFSIAPALFLWSYNFAEVFLREIFVTLLLLLALGAFIAGACQILFRNWHKSALLASLFIILTFAYQHIFFSSSFSLLFFRHRYVLLFIATVVIVAAYVLKKQRNDLSAVNKFFTVVSSVFIILSLVQLGLHNLPDFKDSTSRVVTTSVAEVAQAQRDIYYILLDSYSAPDVLTGVFGLEKETEDSFVHYLEKQGFVLAQNSRSPYPQTVFTLSAVLNMRYHGIGAQERKILVDMLENHFVKDFLKARGYRYIHIGGDWVTYFNRYADENINFGLFSPYQKAVWEATAFAPLEMYFGSLHFFGGRFGFLDGRLTQYKRVQFELEALSNIPAKKEPTFVFAHILVPHVPYVFDAEGEYITKEEEESVDPLDLYLGQVQYINKQIEKVVKDILENSETEPIIVIQGDHGHQISKKSIERLSLTSQEEKEISFRIFNAYYFPNGGGVTIDQSINSINTFPLLFNYYFNQNFNLLKDESYDIEPPDSENLIRFR